MSVKSVEAQQGFTTPGNSLFAVQCIPAVVKYKQTKRHNQPSKVLKISSHNYIGFNQVLSLTEIIQLQVFIQKDVHIAKKKLFQYFS